MIVRKQRIILACLALGLIKISRNLSLPNISAPGGLTPMLFSQQIVRRIAVRGFQFNTTINVLNLMKYSFEITIYMKWMV